MRPSLAVEAVRQVADEARPTLTQSLVVAAVEKVPAPKNKKGKHGHAVKRQHGFFAGNARIAVLPAAAVLPELTADELKSRRETGRAPARKLLAAIATLRRDIGPVPDS